MELIFHRKLTSILFVTAILVLLILACMLLVSLTQLSALNGRVNELNEKIQQAKDEQITKEELLEYMDSNEYVKKWAEDHNRISQDDIAWVYGTDN